uniref:Chemokine interleukin-8-like domain-containing protein n=1 Tax=Crocodylus porosus TaxID=8502 RepID=A0A7M4FUZ2_CROPO
MLLQSSTPTFLVPDPLLLHLSAIPFLDWSDLSSFCTYLHTSSCSLCSCFSVGPDIPKSCCFTYAKWQLPLSFITTYYKTHLLCSQSSIM